MAQRHLRGRLLDGCESIRARNIARQSSKANLIRPHRSLRFYLHRMCCPCAYGFIRTDLPTSSPRICSRRKQAGP